MHHLNHAVPSQLLALSPSVDLSLTTSMQHYHVIVMGLIQVREMAFRPLSQMQHAQSADAAILWND